MKERLKLLVKEQTTKRKRDVNQIKDNRKRILFLRFKSETISPDSSNEIQKLKKQIQDIENYYISNRWVIRGIFLAYNYFLNKTYNQVEKNSSLQKDNFNFVLVTNYAGNVSNTPKAVFEYWINQGTTTKQEIESNYEYLKILDSAIQELKQVGYKKNYNINKLNELSKQRLIDKSNYSTLNSFNYVMDLRYRQLKAANSQADRLNRDYARALKAFHNTHQILSRQ